jgi:asparagine synthase (glutamine-hydrolysing)
MCGIAGFLLLRRTFSEPPRLADLKRMTDAIAHRGPDAEGFHIDGPIALGHRRLSIIDVASGQQPMVSPTGESALVFNGEIYNYLDLMAQLQQAGYVFRTRSDTEVILHGWAHWGERVVDHLRGMFAFALWDKDRQQLFLARDRLGVKPLYYAELPSGEFLFGSELKALMAHPSYSKRIDVRAVDDFFTFGYVPDPKTIHVGSHKLRAAHCLVVDQSVGMREQQRYWHLDYTRKIDLPAEELQAELARRVHEAVRIRLMSEVPLGAFLSGGVDSSVVVAHMSRLMPEKVKTTSIGFSEPEFDESMYADAVAKHLGTDHVLHKLSVDELEGLDAHLKHFDEPFADSSSLATYRVSALARQRVTVALSGDGGDEAFGGYRRYRMHLLEERMRSMLPDAIRKPLFGAAAALYPQARTMPRWLRAKTTLESMAKSPLQAYYRAVTYMLPEMRQSMYSDAMKRELGDYSSFSVFEDQARSFSGSDDAFDLIHHVDLGTWLAGGINTKVDRTSMAVGLEVREPLLDYQLMEWAASLPQALKLNTNDAKIPLKAHARTLVPPEVIDRPKQGFSIPVERWLEGPLKTNAMRANARLTELGLNMKAAHAAGTHSERSGWAMLACGAALEGGV